MMAITASSSIKEKPDRPAFSDGPQSCDSVHFKAVSPGDRLLPESLFRQWTLPFAESRKPSVDLFR